MYNHHWSRSCGFVLALLAGVSGLTPLAVIGQPVSNIPIRWETQQYKPPGDVGSTDQVQGGASRSPLRFDRLPVKALVPDNSFGVTTQAYPTFLVYVPHLTNAPPQVAEFVLEDEDGLEVCRMVFPQSNTGEIITIPLSSQGGLVPLAVNKNYNWVFSLLDARDYSTTMSTGGSIRRVALSQRQQEEIAKGSPSEQISWYVKNGIWYDSIAGLAELYREDGKNPQWRESWQKLLQSVGLSQLSQVSLVISGKEN